MSVCDCVCVCPAPCSLVISSSTSRPPLPFPSPSRLVTPLHSPRRCWFVFIPPRRTQRTELVQHRKSDFCQKETVSRGGVLGVFSSVKGKQKRELLSGRKAKRFLSAVVCLLCAVISSPPPYPVERTFCQCHDCCVLFLLSLSVISKRGQTCLFVLHWCLFVFSKMCFCLVFF